MQKTIPQLLAVVRALSDQRFSSYERFREKVTFQKREFAFSCFFCAFLWSRILLKLLLGVFVIILNILVKTRALLSRRFPSGEFFCLFLRFEKDEFQDRVGSNCCRRHVKGKEATSNTKIVANMPTAAAAAAAAATSTFTATVITANIIDQTFTRFFSVGESRHYWYSIRNDDNLAFFNNHHFFSGVIKPKRSHRPPENQFINHFCGLGTQCWIA